MILLQKDYTPFTFSLKFVNYNCGIPQIVNLNGRYIAEETSFLR
jgi:hypothetical protein